MSRRVFRDELEPLRGWCRDESCKIERLHPPHGAPKLRAPLRAVPALPPARWRAINRESEWRTCGECEGRGCAQCYSGQVPPDRLLRRWGLV